MAHKTKAWENRIEKLRAHLGSHSAVARALGITIRHWMGLRKNPENIKGTLAILIRAYCRIISLAENYSQVRKNINSIVYDPKERGK